jgi:hypothetical protein
LPRPATVVSSSSARAATCSKECVLDVATLRLHAGGTELGRSLLAIRLAGDWSEGTVTWNNQPPTTGPGASVPAGEGYRAWNVKTIVQAMYDAGLNHGFLVQDAVEGTDAEHSFSTRDAENAPQLVLGSSLLSIPYRRPHRRLRHPTPPPPTPPSGPGPHQSPPTPPPHSRSSPPTPTRTWHVRSTAPPSPPAPHPPPTPGSTSATTTSRSEPATPPATPTPAPPHGPGPLQRPTSALDVR